MAKRVIVQGICDRCSTEYVDGSQGQTYTIHDADSKTAYYEIDLCGPCSGILTEGFLNYARVLTKKREKKAAADTGYLPKSGVDMATKMRPLTVPCDQKGCNYMGADNRAIGVHKRREHGIAGGTK